MLNALGEPLFRLILPVIAQRNLGGAINLGLLLAIFAGGGLAGTVLYGAIGHRLSRRPVYIGAFLAVAATYCLILVLPQVLIIAVALALRGAANAPLMLVAVTVTQERVPAHLRARVLGVGRSLALAAIPLVSSPPAIWSSESALIAYSRRPPSRTSSLPVDFG